ncbi:SsrA-binding protein SmpB [Burkholderiaceae bacterium DAT-1]|nr:SsrA-binding protein SmpB [Burkholderiaceae bacterium DAT-1]
MSIIDNKKAFHDYFIEERFEAGLVLEGWEVKSIRAGRVNIKESYVLWQKGAFWLIGCHITPLNSASTHVLPDPTRFRKLLLNQSEINKLIGKVERSGYTLMALNLHYKAGRIKVDIGLARGKKQHDKRDTERARDADREIARAMRTKQKGD